MNRRLVFIIITGIVVILLGYFITKTVVLSAELKEAKREIAADYTNAQVLSFTKLFVDNVIGTKQEVDFETRLQLENAVRSIKDQEIMAGWNAFVGSKTEEQAQEEASKLISLLIRKISQ